MIAIAVVVTLVLILAAAVRLYAVYFFGPMEDDPHDYCADDTRRPEDEP